MQMPRIPLWLIVLINMSPSAAALAQHPGTVFLGTPSQPGMSAPVAFPADPDPGGVASRPPAVPAGLTVDQSDRDGHSDRLFPESGANALGADLTLRTRLLTMLDDDRRVTRFTHGQPADGSVHLTSEIDRTNLVLLKAIVAEHGWPTIAMVGSAASEGASTILLHSEDRGWEKQMAPELQRLVETGKILGPDIAEIVDRLLVLSGKPQKFGTQFEIRNGELVILPVQNPRRLEEWRAGYLLLTMRTWRSTLASTYHMTVTGPPEHSSTR